MQPGLVGCWHRTGRIDRRTARAESLLVGEDQRNLISVVDHNLEECHRTEVAEVGILGGRNPAGSLVVDNPGRSWEGIGCMGLT